MYKKLSWAGLHFYNSFKFNWITKEMMQTFNPVLQVGSQNQTQRICNNQNQNIIATMSKTGKKKNYF